jgi:signal peptidase I
VNPKVKNALEWTYCIIIAVVLALLVRYFVGTPTIVKQPSMYPTLKPDQRLILNRII